MEPGKAPEANNEFGIPADLEKQLRAQAEEAAAKTVDTAALLKRFTAEAIARREAELREDVEASIPPEEKQDLDALGFPRKFVKLVIFKGTNKNDLNYLPIGVNGYVWRIKRGETVIVHSVVVDALNQAVTEVVLQAEGGLITQPAHQYPFSATPATEAEYHAYKAKLAAEGKSVLSTS